MSKSLNITANLDQPVLLENLVEKLASRRYDLGYSAERVPKQLQAVDTSTVQTYVSGTVFLSGLAGNDGDSINVPFITSMLFTCIKGKEDCYRLFWSSSLS